MTRAGGADRHAGGAVRAPAHTFRRHFIGSPGMNVLPCRGRRARRRASAARRSVARAMPAACRGGRDRARHPAGIRRCPPVRHAGAIASRTRPRPHQIVAHRRRRHRSPCARGRRCRRGDEPARSSIRAHASMPTAGWSVGAAPWTRPRTTRPGSWCCRCLLLVAFSAIIPLMTVVNYSVQDTFGNNQFFWNGVGWFQELLPPAASSPRCCASSCSPPSSWRSRSRSAS